MSNPVAEEPSTDNNIPNNSERLPWSPSDPKRWSKLGLSDPNATERPAIQPIADLLLLALTPSGAADPVEGVIEGVQLELAALADCGGSDAADPAAIAEVLGMLERRLALAVQLLKWSDGREQMPRAGELAMREGEP